MRGLWVSCGSGRGRVALAFAFAFASTARRGGWLGLAGAGDRLVLNAAAVRLELSFISGDNDLGASFGKRCCC